MRITLSKLTLVAGDLLTLYVGLIFALLIRYGADFYEPFTEQHLVPFSIVFAIWLIVFYIAGLYDLRRLRNNLEFLKTLGLALFVNAMLAMALFYFIPAFGITPKTNLLLFLVIFAVLEVMWRRLFNRATASSSQKIKVALLGSDKVAEEIAEAVHANPQFGYEIKAWFDGDGSTLFPRTLAEWKALIAKDRIELIVIPRHFRKEASASKIFSELLASGVEVRDVPAFYETIFRKIPLAAIDEEWILDMLAGKEQFYDGLKRGIEFVLAILLGIILLPLEILIALLIKLNTPGPSICTQIRIGKNGKPYTHYKFRSMLSCTEKNGPQWAEKNDKRITAIGRLLRYTHLDELPQLANIAKGELSFVGPRPERPEFVELLREKISYYDTRHLVKPGVTGWAQIEYRYGASVEDAAEKLNYDLYYIKNRSLILDAAILLKNVKLLFVNKK